MEGNVGKEYKIVLVGDTSTGKTNIIMKYTQNKFNKNYDMTYDCLSLPKLLNINGKKIYLEIWDTPGLDYFKAKINYDFGEVDCFLIVYDITNKISFNNIDNWIKLVLEINKYPYIALIGNKLDLNKERKISIEEVLQKAKEYKCDFYEVSALDGKNIDSTFFNFIKKILEEEERANAVLFESDHSMEKEESEESEESEKEDDKIQKDLQEENNNKIIKCSSKNHKDIDAINYCQNCKIYMCNKCTENHSELFEDHFQFNLNKKDNNTDFFTGFCKEKNHFDKIKYFCKLHN